MSKNQRQIRPQDSQMTEITENNQLTNQINDNKNINQQQQIQNEVLSIPNLILDKLCFDKLIYFQKLSKSLQKNQGDIYTHKEQNEEILKQNMIFKELLKFRFFICDEQSNIFIVFSSLFMLQISSCYYLSPIMCLIALYKLIIAIKNRKRKSKIHIYFCFFLQTLLLSLFWYSLIISSYLDYEIKFEFINSLIQVGIFYIFASEVGILIFAVNQYRFQQEYSIDTALEEIEISSDQLYFEVIDRSAIKDSLGMRQKKTNIYQFVERAGQNISQSLKSISSGEAQVFPNLKKKVWNSGYLLLSREQKSFYKYFTLSKYMIRIYIILAAGFVLLHFILPLVYLPKQADSGFDGWNIALICFFNSIYSVFFIINCFVSFLAYESYSKIETFTSLLEINNSMSKYQFRKNTPTLNLYCITSIKTWFYTRQLMLNTNQKMNRLSYLLQGIDICFLSFYSITFLDFLGIGWSMNEIFEDKFVFSFMICNLLSRFLLFIIPIFFNYSYVNEMLLYNKQQIDTIQHKLYNILKEYRSLRNLWANRFQNLLVKELDEISQQQLIQELLNQEQERKFKINFNRQDIEQLRVIHEIQRNTELFSAVNLIESNTQSINYQDLNHDSRIDREIEYLSTLIETYKFIYEEMIKKEEKNMLKLVGIVTVTYSKASALLLIALPAPFAILFQHLKS